MDARRVRESRRGAAGVWVSSLHFVCVRACECDRDVSRFFSAPLEKKGKITLRPLIMREKETCEKYV